MTHDLIIFDCDGTLVDSEYLNNKALVDALIRNGVRAYTPEYAFQHFTGLSLEELMVLVKAEQSVDLPPSFITDFAELAAANKKEFLQPIPGALEAVEELASRYKICVASNGERDLVLQSLELTGLDKFFPETSVFSQAQVPCTNGKPEPDLMLHCAKHMDALPGNCLVIEDSVYGVMAARASGMDVIGFNGAAHDTAISRDKLLEAGAPVVYATWPQIIAHIDNGGEIMGPDADTLTATA